MKKLFAIAPLLAMIGALPVEASSIAYIDPASQGTQSYTGNLALLFHVNSPINVTALGVYNALGDGIITGPISVAIYLTGSNTRVTPVVTFQGQYTPGGLGFDVFQSITATTLGPGSYEVDAVGFSDADRNGNLNTGSSSGPVLNDGGGFITFTGAAYDGSTFLDAPVTCGGCQGTPAQTRQFDAGTFEFTGVPEPATFALFGGGLIGLAAILRRRQGR